MQHLRLIVRQMYARIAQHLHRLYKYLAGINTYIRNIRGRYAYQSHPQILIQLIGLGNPYDITGCYKKQRTRGQMIIGQIDRTVN